MKKLQYDRYLAFEVEKVLIGLHPNAEYIRVDCGRDGGPDGRSGLVAEVIENGHFLDTAREMVEYLDRKLREMQDQTPDVLTPTAL
jgi:hypothetical protein